jgi:PEP-CTERM motif
LEKTVKKKYGRTFAFASLFVGAIAAQATPITFDFGSGTNVSSAWHPTSDAGFLTLGVALAPVTLDGGLFSITGSGAVDCVLGSSFNGCADSNNLSTLTSYGLGIGDGRVDPGETLTLTILGSNLSVKFVGFSVTGFAGSDKLQYSLDGKLATIVSAPSTDVALDSVTLSQPAVFTNNITFSIPSGNNGNFSLSTLTLDVAPSVPEPATFGLAGLALVGVALVRRKRRA